MSTTFPVGQLTSNNLWWDGTLTIGGAPAGALVRFRVGDSTLLETRTTEGGHAAFFDNRPAIPLSAVQFQALAIEAVSPNVAGPLSLGHAGPVVDTRPHMSPVAIPGQQRPQIMSAKIDPRYNNIIMVDRGLIYPRYKATAQDATFNEALNAALGAAR
jgi:hypothetical protein